MKKLFISILIILLTCIMASSHTELSRRLYLGQLPPWNIPIRFELSVNSGSFAAERIAISNDGKEIYYTEVKSYCPACGDTIKCYRFLGGKWRGPFNIFPGYLSPALSLTPDKKYLFYTGTKSDYSDTGIFRVRIDNLIVSLKNTNNVPYLQKRLESKAGFVNQKADFTIPEDAFLDDDGETTFSYSAILNTGQPLPDWLTFDKLTGRFYGSQSEYAEYTVIVTAPDKEDAEGLGVFKLLIKEKQ